MRLLGTNILIKPEIPEQPNSGILRSEIKKPDIDKGTVVLIGQGLPDEPMDVAIGDYIKFRNNAGIPIMHDGQPHLIVNQSDVQAILG